MDCVDFFTPLIENCFKRKKVPICENRAVGKFKLQKERGELNFGPKILIPNIVIPLLQVRTLSEKFYITQKKSDFGRFQFVASKAILEF